MAIKSINELPSGQRKLLAGLATVFVVGVLVAFWFIDKTVFAITLGGIGVLVVLGLIGGLTKKRT